MKSQNVSYMPELDHIRLFAALFITVFHLANGPLVHILHLDIGVPLFFALSGFLFFSIANKKNREINYWKFIKNRLLRIYPLITFLFFLAIVVMKDFTAIDYINLFGLNLPGTGEVSWASGDWGYRYISFNWWTVGVEFIFYLLFPFIYDFYKREGVSFLWRAIFLIVLFRFGLYYTFLQEYGWKTLSINLNYAVFGNFDIFLIGMLMAHYLCQIREGSFIFKVVHSKIVLLIYVVAMWFFIIYCLDMFDQTLSPVVTGVLCSVLILLYSQAFMYSRDTSWSRILAYGGTISFSIYLLHGFVKDALQGSGATASFMRLAAYTLGESIAHNSFFLCFFFYVPCTLTISYLTYRTIEKPFLDIRTTY